MKKHLYICTGYLSSDHCRDTCPCGKPHYSSECTGEDVCAATNNFVRCRKAGKIILDKFKEE